MKRIALIATLFAGAAVLPACDDILGGGDGGTADMAVAADMAKPVYRLPEGVYKVTALRNKDDKCMIDNPAGSVIGTMYGIRNDQTIVKFGGLNGMMPAADTGMPPQPSLGMSCSMKTDVPCSTEAGWMPYADNTLWVVRDNNVVPDANCTYHRHVVNVIKLSADGKFTSQFSREDSMIGMGCMGVTACKTTWEWDLEWQNAFK